MNSFGPKVKDSEIKEFEKQPSSESSKKVKAEEPIAASSKGKAILSNTGNSSAILSANSSNSTHSPGTQLWTEKYRPETCDQVIGNNTLIQKLAEWLRTWNKNKSLGFPKGGKDDFSGFRAALLSGPPGIGKTTAAHLVAKMEGYEAIEFNASDTRSKKALEVRFNLFSSVLLTVTRMLSKKRLKLEQLQIYFSGKG